MTDGMTDDELLAKFEAAALAGSEFHHREHVRVAWLYLRRLPLLVAAVRFHGGLVRLATALGVPRLYHATITWAYLLLIHERMARRPAGESWDEFAAASPDLLTWKPSALAIYYSDGVLAGDDARERLVLPDLHDLQASDLPAGLPM